MAHHAPAACRHVTVRIALVVPEYPPDTIGGGGVVFAALAEHFGVRHQVAVFSAWDARRGWADAPTADRVDGANINRYPLLPVLRSMPNLRSVVPPNLRCIAALRSDLRRWAPDVGHVHGYGYAFVDLGAAFLRRSRTPYVFTFHGVPTTQGVAPPPVRAAYRTYESIGLRRTVLGAAATTAVSPAAAGHWRVDRFIPNGIAAPAAPMATTSAREAVQALKRRFHIPDRAPLAVGVGRLARSKGFDLLIAASPLLAKNDTAIVLAGADGGHEAELRDLAYKASCRVVFTGQLEREELGHLLAAATVVVVPSRDEPFGLVPLEALQAGARVVAASVGGLRLTVRPPWGELVPPDDVPALAAAINRGLLRGPLTTAEREEAHVVLEEYSWPRVVAEYEVTLRHAAGKEVPRS